MFISIQEKVNDCTGETLVNLNQVKYFAWPLHENTKFTHIHFGGGQILKTLETREAIEAKLAAVLKTVVQE